MSAKTRDPGAGDLDALRRLASYSVVLAIVVAVVSSLLFFAAYGWDIEGALFGDPRAIDGGASAAAPLRDGCLARISMVCLLRSAPADHHVVRWTTRAVSWRRW